MAVSSVSNNQGSNIPTKEVIDTFTLNESAAGPSVQNPQTGAGDTQADPTPPENATPATPATPPAQQKPSQTSPSAPPSPSTETPSEAAPAAPKKLQFADFQKFVLTAEGKQLRDLGRKAGLDPQQNEAFVRAVWQTGQSGTPIDQNAVAQLAQAAKTDTAKVFAQTAQNFGGRYIPEKYLSQAASSAPASSAAPETTPAPQASREGVAPAANGGPSAANGKVADLEAQIQTKIKLVYDAANVNNDDGVDENEFEAAAKVAQGDKYKPGEFAKIDTSKKGKVSFPEYASYIAVTLQKDMPKIKEVAKKQGVSQEELQAQLPTLILNELDKQLELIQQYRVSQTGGAQSPQASKS